jgi:L-lactate dehydrogenase complex protein LldG
MSVASTLVQKFTKELETLGGKSYEASSVNGIAKIICDIATRSRSKNIIKQKLAIDQEYLILTELRDHGFQVTELENLTQPIVELTSADMAITRADLIIAGTGTIVMTTRSDEDRLASCLPRVHVAIAQLTKIVIEPNDAGNYIREQLRREPNCTISFISGPSRTADIEMKLILGVHGPHEVHVILKR